MALSIYDNSATLRQVLEVQDLSNLKFVCVGGLVEPIVSTLGVLEGSGHSLDPLYIGPGLPGQVLTVVGAAVVWSDPASDNMVDASPVYSSGASRIRHTTVDGNDFDFAEGFQSVQTSADCITPGVGATKSVKSVSISANALIIEAAAEHSSAHIGTAGAQALALPIDVLGTVIADSVVGPVTINNPSACRSMALAVVYDFGAQFIFTTGGIWLWEGRVSINGAPYVTTASSPWGTFPGLIGLPGVMVAGDNFTLPPSGSRSYALQNRLTTTQASVPGSFWNASSKGLRGLGSTI
jgi:hypothetical protein